MRTLVIVTLALLSNGVVGCSNGWLESGGSCYGFFQGESVPWEDARLFCQNMGGDLAKVPDSLVLRDLYEYIITYGLGGSYWLGASDLVVEGDWLWAVDNSRVERGTPYWALHSGLFGWDHEPSGGKDENCLCLDSTRKYYFNDANCNLIYHPICMVAV